MAPRCGRSVQCRHFLYNPETGSDAEPRFVASVAIAARVQSIADPAGRVLAGALCRAGGLRRRAVEQPLPVVRPGGIDSLHHLPGAAETPRSGILLERERSADHEPGLRAARPVPLPASPLQAGTTDRARRPGAGLLRPQGARAAGRCTGCENSPRRLSHRHPARHSLPATPGLRAPRGRRPSLPRTGRDARRQRTCAGGLSPAGQP